MTEEPAADVLLIGGHGDDLARVHAVLLETGRRAVVEREVDPPVGDEAADPLPGEPTDPPELALVIRPDADTVLDLVRSLADRRAAQRIVVLADERDDDDLVVRTLRAGADGWLPIRRAPGDLERCVRTVIAGETPLGPRHLAALVRAARATGHAAPQLSGRRVHDATTGSEPGPDALPIQRGREGQGGSSGPSPSVPALAPAELRIAELAALGRTDKQIAAELFMSRHSVAAHLKAVAAKLGVRTRADLAHVVRRDEPRAHEGPGALSDRASGHRHRD